MSNVKNHTFSLRDHDMKNVMVCLDESEVREFTSALSSDKGTINGLSPTNPRMLENFLSYIKINGEVCFRLSGEGGYGRRECYKGGGFDFVYWGDYKNSNAGVGKYQALTNSLQAAKVNAEMRAALEDDGGTCNFDSLVLFLPRWNEQMVLDATADAGLRAYKTKWCGKPAYIFSNPVPSQGNQRTVQAEAMKEYMQSVGYDAAVYYQMD